MMSNTMSIGVNGVQDAQLGMQDAASRIARNGTTERAQQSGGEQASARGGGESLAEPIVDLQMNQRNAEASVEVVRTADEMVGTLLDERA